MFLTGILKPLKGKEAGVIFQAHSYKWVLLGTSCALVSQHAKKQGQDKHQGKKVRVTNEVFIFNCFLQLCLIILNSPKRKLQTPLLHTWTSEHFHEDRPRCPFVKFTSVLLRQTRANLRLFFH